VCSRIATSHLNKVSISKGHTKILVTLLVVLGLNSCAGIYSVVDFEVLEPATVSFPDDVGQLIILNRAPLSLDVLQEEDRQEMEREHLFIIDTTVSMNIFRGLLGVLQQSPIKQFHTPFWLSERRADTASLDDLILTKREVTMLCNTYGADAIISLELYLLDLNRHLVPYSNGSDLLQTSYYEASNKLSWNIYLPGNPKPFNSYTTIDTLYYTDMMNGQSQPVPTGLEMVSELFYESGMKYGRYLAPVWTNTSRMLYKGKGDSLKLASKHTSRGEWDMAYEIWKGLTVAGDSTQASKAYNNMAIYYELEDNLDSASHLLDRALEYDTLEAVRFYREELDIRILNRNELQKQVK